METTPPREDHLGPSSLEKGRQKGRQSGRFRKSATTPSLAAASPSSLVSPPQAQYLAAVAQGPGPPHLQKNNSVSRTESYRRARGERGEPPKRGEQFNSLPRRGGRAAALARANSEDSVREAIAREEGRRGKEKGECSVM